MIGAWTQEWSRLLFVILLSLGIATTQTRAQDASTEAGAISGVVVDKKNGESLPGANVSIKGTTTGTTTDLKGRYRLTGLEPGTYKVLFSFVGFQDKTITGVTVKPGETTTLDITLAEETAQMEEVVVQAEAARDSEAGMLKDRAKAASVNNAISAEEISRSGSGDAASAMGNVTGASVVEGKYVNVRGLQGRYVDVQLNGVTLPSADPDGNSVALDIFPSSLIDNIVTSKTFTPDKPGTFTGGAIDITTKSFPDDFFLNASVSTSVNSEVGVGGNMLRPPDGLESVPAAADDENLPLNPTSIPERREALDNLSKAFATGVAPRSDDVLGNRGAEVAAGNQFSILGDRSLGVIAALTYDKSFSGYSGGTTARFSQTGSGSTRLKPEASYTTQRGVEETLWGGLAGLSFQVSPKHEFGLRLLYNRDDEEIARFDSGALPRDLSGGRKFQTRVARQIERTIRSAQLDGTHQFGEGKDGVQFEWKTAFAEVDRDEPDNRFFQNEFTPTETDTTFRISGPVTNLPTRYFRNLEERDWTGEASVEVPVGSATLEAGGSIRTKTREFRERQFEHNSESVNYNGNPNRYVNEQAGILESGAFGTFIQEVASIRGNYDGSQDTGAGYLMVDTPVPGFEPLKFVGGARLEYTEMSLSTVSDRAQFEGSFSQFDVLPSANLVWSLRDDMNVRFAYGRTIALPAFREFAPFESFSFIGDFLEQGNPNLERTSVDNFDLRWEWFPRSGELLSASVYYKAFNDPIERTIKPESPGANTVVTYRNREEATVYGLELEARKRLDDVASWLEHFQVGGNLTITESEIDRTEAVLEQIRLFRDNPDETRQLQGQSPYIVNLNAGYDNLDSGTTVNVFFNRFGDRLQTVAPNGADIFERARSTLDINVSQRLLRNVTAKMSVKNVLNSDETISQEFKGNEFVNDQRPLGRTISVGVSYSY